MPRKKEKGSAYALRLQIIEADRVSNPSYEQDTETMIGGIEKDKFGAPIRYHIMDGHPGNHLTAPGMTWTPVDAFGAKTGRRNVLHLFSKARPGQTRGIPDLAAVIEPLKQLGRYTEAELSAAVISGMFTVFVKTEGNHSLAPVEPTSETGAAATDKDIKLANGLIVGLAPNESIETANPGRPNDSFDPFMQAILRQVGVALELPFELLIKHFTSSYTAARAALIEAWRFFIVRRKWLISRLCRPVLENFMDEAVSSGRINAPGYINGDFAVRAAYLRSMWIGPPRGQVDPLKENQADVIAEDRGWKTASENTAERGGDWASKHRQRALEVRKRAEDGLTVAVPGPLPDEDEDKDDDDGDDEE